MEAGAGARPCRVLGIGSWTVAGGQVGCGADGASRLGLVGWVALHSAVSLGAMSLPRVLVRSSIWYRVSPRRGRRNFAWARARSSRARASSSTGWTLASPLRSGRRQRKAGRRFCLLVMMPQQGAEPRFGASREFNGRGGWMPLIIGWSGGGVVFIHPVRGWGGGRCK